MCFGVLFYSHFQIYTGATSVNNNGKNAAAAAGPNKAALPQADAARSSSCLVASDNNDSRFNLDNRFSSPIYNPLAVIHWLQTLPLSI
jgi:hypothetical protein